MDKKIIDKLLVPLDGSILAESVLPLAAQIAKKLDVSITFIHIIEKDAPQKIHGQQHLTNPTQAEDYLKSIVAKDIFKNVKTEIHVHEPKEKDVSRSISDHSKELNQDLVIMCTHGSGGLHDFIFGSNASQVISLGVTPVLLVNPSAEYKDKEISFKNFLVPLDGNPDHEHVLDYAAYLAKLFEANLNLLIAIPQFGTMSGELTPVNRLLPQTTSKMLDMIVPDALEYLDKLKLKLEKSGLKVTVKTSRNNPVRAITETSKKIKADLIILATHGKKGADAYLEGSLTPKISKASKTPILLVPVK